MKYSVSLAGAMIALVGLFGAGCASTPSQQTQQEQQAKPQVRITGCEPKAIAIQEPAANATVKMPFDVKVQIHNGIHKDCRWGLFEGQAGSLTLQDEKGTILGRGILATDEDWMTDEQVGFNGMVHPVPGTTAQGKLTLVISEDDPSGQKDPQAIMVPLIVTP
ncbi:MAG: hypothetical protein ABIO72_02150 [Patescibacteria group bacterium]